MYYQHPTMFAPQQQKVQPEEVKEGFAPLTADANEQGALTI